MKINMHLALAVALALSLTLPLLAQRGEEQHQPSSGEAQMQHPAQNAPRANQGRIPAPPPKREPRAKPEVERREGGHVNSIPHVANDHWYGHAKPNDPRFHLDRPFEHGHFANFGPSYRYNVLRIDPNLRRFWLPGGYYFDVAPWDWALASDWCWSCGEDFVVYEDPDHPGWYLLYNLMTGAFVHVLYMGM